MTMNVSCPWPQISKSDITCNDTVLDHTEELIDALQSLQKPATALFLRKKAGNDNAGNTEPWQELQHYSSRLLAYRRAVVALWDAGSMWPSLFENFQVTCIQSSSRDPNPLKTSPQTASEILNRLTFSPAETKGEYLDLAKTMQQKFDLDDRIEEEWTSNSFCPIVHAEMLVQNWLEKTGGPNPGRFFHRWQYIGCSKPTCKLCHYYFTNHPGGVQTRGTHGNLYRNWRMPDYADVYGLRTKEEALVKRHEILQGIMGNLRECVLRNLREKTSDYRPCDSSTISSFAPNANSIGMGVQNSNKLVSRMRSNDLTSAEPQPSVSNEDWETMEGESEAGEMSKSSQEIETSSSVD